MKEESEGQQRGDLFMDWSEAWHAGHTGLERMAGTADSAAAPHEAQLLSQATQLHLLPLLHPCLTQLYCPHLLLCL